MVDSSMLRWTIRRADVALDSISSMVTFFRASRLSGDGNVKPLRPAMARHKQKIRQPKMAEGYLMSADCVIDITAAHYNIWHLYDHVGGSGRLDPLFDTSESGQLF